MRSLRLNCQGLCRCARDLHLSARVSSVSRVSIYHLRSRSLSEGKSYLSIFTSRFHVNANKTISAVVYTSKLKAVPHKRAGNIELMY